MRHKLISLVISLCLVFGLFSGVRADTSEGVEGFVTRLYEICLEREPDQGGFNSWVNNLRTGRVTGSQAARGFLFSNEFTGRNLDSRSFVVCLYRTMFGREADDTGLNSWTAMLNAGSTREEVFNGFVASSEWSSVCSSYGINPGLAPQTSTGSQTGSADEFINRMYSGFLGRNADSVGLADWRSRLSSGSTTGSEAAYGFMRSSEFISRASSMSSTAIVSVFYSTFLGRNPTASEVSSYTSRMTGNLNSDLEMLFFSFANSDEFISYCEDHGIVPGSGNGASMISDADVTSLFNNALLIGSSTTEGFNLYFSRYGRGIMGNITVCSRVSYSLLNDMTNRTSYIPMLNGTPMRARDLISNSGARYAFICMGTNDIQNGVVQRYCTWLDDIRSNNPNTVIFIEACTPSLDEHPSNADIRALNAGMQQYCDTHAGFYFIDTYSPLADGNGVLQSRYCSDGNVHITYQGYGEWINTLTEYVRQYIYEQRVAGNDLGF